MKDLEQFCTARGVNPINQVNQDQIEELLDQELRLKKLIETIDTLTQRVEWLEEKFEK